MVSRNNKGFTIVELLIVIVVIAILASITVVAYSTTQTRAIASKASATADTYLKALELYKVDNGTYPTFSDLPAGAYACLSPAGSLPAEAPYAVNQCDTAYSGAFISAELNAKLAPYIGQMPDSKLPSVNWGSGRNMRAIEYAPQNDVNPLLRYTRFQMYFLLKGNYDCPRATEKDSWATGTTACEYW